MIRAALLALLLTGCARAQWVTYDQTKTQQDFYRDDAQCMAMGSAPTPNYLPGNDPFSAGWNNAEVAKTNGKRSRIYKHCMMGSGWVLERR